MTSTRTIAFSAPGCMWMLSSERNQSGKSENCELDTCKFQVQFFLFEVGIESVAETMWKKFKVGRVGLRSGDLSRRTTMINLMKRLIYWNRHKSWQPLKYKLVSWTKLDIFKAVRLESITLKELNDQWTPEEQWCRPWVSISDSS